MQKEASLDFGDLNMLVLGLGWFSKVSSTILRFGSLFLAFVLMSWILFWLKLFLFLKNLFTQLLSRRLSKNKLFGRKLALLSGLTRDDLRGCLKGIFFVI